MNERIEQCRAEIHAHIAQASSPDAVEAIRIAYLGKKGKVTELLHCISSVSGDERKTFGRDVNLLKREVEAALAAKKAGLGAPQSKGGALDHTMPGIPRPLGHIHPLTQTVREISSIFERLGFEIVSGREIETERYNFTALNIPLDHPSRDAFDTFYTQDHHLLRSQTSTVQVRVMESRKPPLAIVAPGKVYRPDTVDASHSFMFHQIEGLMVDTTITFADLKGVLHLFLKEYFGPDSRMIFRPHYFPFTEPSAEVDVSCFRCGGSGCSTCSHKGWLEVLGAGAVNPAVFEAVGYDPTVYRGFAFGLGVERMCMLKNGIHDIRLFYENNVKFLNQF